MVCPLPVACGAAADTAQQACTVMLAFLVSQSGCPTEYNLTVQVGSEARALRPAMLRAEVAYRARLLAGCQCAAALPLTTAPLTTRIEDGPPPDLWRGRKSGL